MIEGIAEDAQTVWWAMYNTVNKLIEEGSLAQGRDVRRSFMTIVS
jgi:hypothetical protein